MIKSPNGFDLCPEKYQSPKTEHNNSDDLYNCVRFVHGFVFYLWTTAESISWSTNAHYLYDKQCFSTMYLCHVCLVVCVFLKVATRILVFLIDETLIVCTKSVYIKVRTTMLEQHGSTLAHDSSAALSQKPYSICVFVLKGLSRALSFFCNLLESSIF